jgi:hypothetical protein
MNYLFPIFATIILLFGLFFRREKIRKVAVLTLGGVSILYLLLEPGAVLRPLIASTSQGFSQGVSVAGVALDKVHMWIIAMTIGLTILGIMKFNK